MPSTGLAQFDIAPYGGRYADILARAQVRLQGVLLGAIAASIEDLKLTPEFAELWSRYSPDEQQDLIVSEHRHLRIVFDADTDESEHRAIALEIGRTHELSSFDLALVTKFHKFVYRFLLDSLKDDLQPDERDTLNICVAHRLMIDLTCQARSHHEYQSRVSQLFIAVDRHIESSGNLTDLISNVSDALTAFDGISGILFSRPDERGELQIETSGGERGREYALALLNGVAPMFSIDAASVGGNGPAGRAWRSRTIKVSESNLTDSTVDLWSDLRRRIGFRSSAAVPLLDNQGEPFALLSLYSDVPGYFSGVSRALILRYLQQALGHAMRQFQTSTVIPLVMRRHYIQLMETGHVEIFYQPIINLKSGDVAHLEALARLREADGKIIPPGAFLPALGRSGLHRLFELGFERACLDLLQLRNDRRYESARISVNLPADGLGDPNYLSTIRRLLEKHGRSGRDFILEVLESSELLDAARMEQAIADLRAIGLQIVQDDLGAGHSSLLRLDRIGFDGVKIDQALVRRASERPWRALEFMYHLTNLAHDVHVPVTMEGLENRGLIEASRLFGADCGQGFGIARPMPLAQLMQWSVPDEAQTSASGSPTTVLGLMAHLLLWERTQKYRARRGVRKPDEFEPFDVDLSAIRSSAMQVDLIIRLIQDVSEAVVEGLSSELYLQTRFILIMALKEAWLKDSAQTP